MSHLATSQTSSEVMLRMHGLRKVFGERVLFEIPELAILRAQAVVLTGVNGAGKSTLMRMLAGLESADDARVEVEGVMLPLTPFPAALRARIAYVHQHPYLFRTSVRANIAFGLKARGVASHAVADRVNEALVWAGIEGICDTPPHRLSGGEIQRVALARAWALDPDLLLLDEPTSNLDGAAREQVIALVGDWVAQGKSLLMICHDRDLIALPGITRWKLSEGRLTVRTAGQASLHSAGQA
jgi:tungstate transport system ATP-binding protein